MTEWIVTAVIYVMLGCLIASGNPVAIACAGLWIGGGLILAGGSRSRGFWADASFVATWPIYVGLGR